jgi:heme oxygenase
MTTNDDKLDPKEGLTTDGAAEEEEEEEEEMATRSRPLQLLLRRRSPEEKEDHPPRSLTLTERMRQASKDQHDQSDKLVNIKLALVLTSKALYAEAISLFWPIYAELETILEIHKTHPQLGCLYPLLPLLRRAPLFEKDMTALLGEGGGGGTAKEEEEDSQDVGAATELKRRRIIVDDNGIETFSPSELQRYISHLRTLSKEDPLLLLPYIYSMYSAILAGGAIIQRMVKTAFSLKTNAGVELFQMSFSSKEEEEEVSAQQLQQQQQQQTQPLMFSNRAEFRTAFRRIIDHDMEISESDQVRIVEEAPRVFVRNNALVATARDTDAFRTVWATFQTYLWMIPASVGAVILAVWLSPRLGKK